MTIFRATAAWLRPRPWVIAWLWMVPAILMPVVPIDETRYLSIAWEMWRSGDVIGLTLNGQPYMDKPPLLFWLVNLAWTLFGVSTTAARVVGVACAAASVALVSRLATSFGLGAPFIAGWMLLPFVVFGAFSPVVMFDVPLVGFVVLGWIGLHGWLQDGRWRGCLLVFVAAGLGLLLKGPVYLLHLAGPLMLVRWWCREPLPGMGRRVAILFIVLLTACIPLAGWAVSSALRMHGVAVLDTLTHQSVGRVAQSFAHRRGTFWYLPWLLPFLLPWSLLVRWRRVAGAFRAVMRTPSGRFGVAATLPGVVMFSIISGKQIHYLLPLLPGFAILLGTACESDLRLLHHDRTRILLALASLIWAWPVASSMVGMQGHASWYGAAMVSVALLGLGAVVTEWRAHPPGERTMRSSIAACCALMSAVLLLGTRVESRMDPQGLADAVGTLQRSGVPVAAVDDEPGMVNYLARLPTPLPVIVHAEAWATRYPTGYALVHAGHGAPPSFVEWCVTLADGWEGLVPAGYLTQVHPDAPASP